MYPVPGVIRTVTPLDREAVPHYWLTVAAEDHGLVPKYTTVQVSYWYLMFAAKKKHHDLLDDKSAARIANNNPAPIDRYNI